MSADKLSATYPQDVYRQPTYLATALDNKTLNTYSDDPLSLLADVASMAPTTNAPPPPSTDVSYTQTYSGRVQSVILLHMYEHITIMY